MTNLKHQTYNLSFAGCGFLGLYHAGVSACIQNCAPQLYKNKKCKIAGASAGAIAAAFLICDVDLSDCVQYLNNIINESRQYFLGPFDPRFKVTQRLMEGLELYLPENAHEICNGRLYISLTNAQTKENVVVSNYYSKKDLIKAICCSSFIPIFSGFVPFMYRGMPMIDGAFTKNILCLDENTIEVSPFAGDSHICPKDEVDYGKFRLKGMDLFLNVSNLERFIYIMWPKSSEDLGKLIQQGYRDALYFLRLKGFIKCDMHRCHTYFMKLKINKPTVKIARDDCVQCRRHIKESLNSDISENILKNFAPQSTYWSRRLDTVNNLLDIAKKLTKIAILPVSTSVSLINQMVNIVQNVPSMASSFTKIINIDRVLQQAVGESLEFGQDQMNIHYAMKHHIQFHHDYENNNNQHCLSTDSTDSQIIQSDSSRSCSLDSNDHFEHLHHSIVLDSEDNNSSAKKYVLPCCFHEQNICIGDMHQIQVSEYDDNSDVCRRKSDAESSSARSSISESEDSRGDADGQSDSDYGLLISPNNLDKAKSMSYLLDEHHQQNKCRQNLERQLECKNNLTWSEPDLEHTDQMKYYVLGMRFDDKQQH